MNSMKKILILHTSVGHGIKITAQNIYMRLIKSGKYEARIEDFHEVQPGLAVTVLEKIYFFFTETAPWIWAFLYTEAVASIAIPLRMIPASFRYKKILAQIRNFQPDIVISTETVPTGVVAYLKKKNLYSGKLAVAFSDYHLHRFWLYDEVDLYLCNISEQATELQALGVPAKKTAVTGMVVSDKYLEKVSRAEAAAKHEIDPKKKAVLVSGGRRGLQASREIVQKLLESPSPFQIIVVTGKNVRLKQELEQLSATASHDLKILGYVTDQEVLMSAADLIISKPGGPTIAEAVAKGLPVIVTDAHAGHEMKNMQYLEHHNVAFHGKNPAEVVKLVEMILRGEIKHDKALAFERIIKPKDSLELTAALKRLI